MEKLFILGISAVAALNWIAWPRIVKSTWPTSPALQRNLVFTPEQAVIFGRAVSAVGVVGGLTFLLFAMAAELLGQG